MALAQEMQKRLEAAFQPKSLEIRDDSESHRGHSGFREGGESHWHVAISADAFAPMSRLERHRAVHVALGADIVGRIHALELKITA